MNEDTKSIIAILLGVVILLILGWALFALYAEYNVWASGKSGEAKLREAQWSRQVAVKSALAKKEAAVLLADAEVERARGVAKANKIIGQSLEHNEAYLRYLWIDHLQNERNQVIYVPTETNLPILEANRIKRK
jgi:regulator of protease activity HflC (stomatin/prohibitin superfamily)